MKIIDAVCFDLYSTLVHEDPSNPFYHDIATALGLDLDLWLPAYRKRGKDSMSGRITTMSERVMYAGMDVGQVRTPSEVAAAVDRCFPAFAKSVTIDADASELLARLKASGKRMALISNASSYSEQILDDLGLRSWFDSVVLSYVVGCLKPDPQIYLRALEDLGIPPAAAVFVGDGGDKELAGARQVGLRTVLIDRQLSHTDMAREHADHEVKNLRDVGNIVL